MWPIFHPFRHLWPHKASNHYANYQLASLLRVGTNELKQIRLGPRYHYRPFTIQKPDGRERRILAPSPALKQLQHNFLRGYLAKQPRHPAATAFYRGASILHNAQMHAGQALVATLDIKDFFETTHAGRVRAWFLRQGWKGELLAVLMRLCVYRNGLPQGAPTSPALSNLVNFDLDLAFEKLAERAAARYTRYGDDLTFSWAEPVLPAYFESGVREVLFRFGYAAQPLKDWRVQGLAEAPQVTGLVLSPDGKVRWPWAIHWRIWQLRLRWWWDRDPVTLTQLHGYESLLHLTGERNSKK